MENKREPTSTKSPRKLQTAPKEFYGSSKKDILKKFEPLFDLLHKNHFKKALKNTLIDEYIVFLETIKATLSSEEIKFKKIKKFEKFFIPINTTGFFANSKALTINLNDESLKEQLLSIIKKDALPKEEDLLKLLEKFIDDCRRSIINTLLSNSSDYDAFTRPLLSIDARRSSQISFSPS